jgi:hypothetical protein
MRSMDVVPTGCPTSRCTGKWSRTVLHLETCITYTGIINNIKYYIIPFVLILAGR